ncbi:MAG: DUF2267 domain-containing protein [Reichenbachiella sp.]|uniref:DUF2267 domain-containing protein n=1 Tax=Reichenbachiella sp. TaxID=2184521 RepID=UPI0032645EA7
MALDFNKFAAQGNEFINKLSKELGHPGDSARAGRVLKSVLQALRNQLTTEESIQMLAQLPMFLKAVFVENWRLSGPKKVRHLEDFFDEVRRIDGQSAKYDFYLDQDMDKALKAVLLLLGKYISAGELDDIRAVLPKELKPIIDRAYLA